VRHGTKHWKKNSLLKDVEKHENFLIKFIIVIIWDRHAADLMRKFISPPSTGELMKFTEQWQYLKPLPVEHQRVQISILH
jgi:hypothetical protein